MRFGDHRRIGHESLSISKTIITGTQRYARVLTRQVHFYHECELSDVTRNLVCAATILEHDVSVTDFLQDPSPEMARTFLKNAL